MNVVEPLEEEAKSGSRLHKSTDYFTKYTAVESALYKGTSKSKKLPAALDIQVLKPVVETC